MLIESKSFITLFVSLTITGVPIAAWYFKNDTVNTQNNVKASGTTQNDADQYTGGSSDVM